MTATQEAGCLQLSTQDPIQGQIEALRKAFWGEVSKRNDVVAAALLRAITFKVEEGNLSKELHYTVADEARSLFESFVQSYLAAGQSPLTETASALCSSLVTGWLGTDGEGESLLAHTIANGDGTLAYEKLVPLVETELRKQLKLAHATKALRFFKLVSDVSHYVIYLR